MHDLTGFRTDPVVDPATRGPRLDPAFTQAVITQTGPNANARVADLFAAFIPRMHDLIREMKVTTVEFKMIMEYIARAAKADQLMLLIGTLGLAVVCDEITFEVEKSAEPTTYTGIGPYYRPGAPIRSMGSSIVDSGFEAADHVLIHGKVLDSETGAAVANAELDLWEAGTNGLYDHEDPEQPWWNLRGRFETGSDGSYSFIVLRPTPYPLPTKTMAGDFLKLLDRHPMRPGHLHVKLEASGYLPLITELYEENDKYLDSDVVFDVHNALIMRFEPCKKEPSKGYNFELNYDFRLISKAYSKTHGMKAAEDWVSAVLTPY